jgi:hypothetical protein
MDLANDELKYEARNFIPLFTRAKQEGLKITLHAGETIQKSFAQRVKDAIDLFGAERVGMYHINFVQHSQIQQFESGHCECVVFRLFTVHSVFIQESFNAIQLLRVLFNIHLINDITATNFRLLQVSRS